MSQRRPRRVGGGEALERRTTELREENADPRADLAALRVMVNQLSERRAER